MKGGRATRVEESVTIDRPIDDVFAYLSDVEKHREWIGAVMHTRLTSSGPIGVGTTYLEEGKMLGRRMQVTWSISAYEPPRLIEQRAASGPARGLIRCTLETTGGGTRVDVVQEGEPGGLVRLADPFLARTIKHHLVTDLGTLKRVLER